MNKTFEIFYAPSSGKTPVVFPKSATIQTIEDLENIAKFDHTPALLKDNYREEKNFIGTNCIITDCDNDGEIKKVKKEDGTTETININPAPDEWLTPEKIAERFPNTAFYIVTSRNNNKVKHPGEGIKERSARPRFHIYFPLNEPVSNVRTIKLTQKLIHEICPETDKNAMDAVRLFYGHKEPKAAYFDGELDIIQCFDQPEILRKATMAISTDYTVKKAEQTRVKVHSPEDFDNEFIDSNAWTILECIPADCSEKEWSAVAYSLKKDGLPFELFDRWSATAPSAYNGKYKDKTGAEACWQKWKEKKPRGETNLGFGYLYNLALQNDPSLKDRIIKTGKYAKKPSRLKATETQTVDLETGEILIMDEKNNNTNGLTVHLATEQPKTEPMQNKQKEIPQLITYDADYFNTAEIEEPTPIIERLLYPGLGTLGSPPKMGKSYMVFQLCVAVATGEDFLGYKIVRKGSVLYLDLQGTRARTKKRLHSMGYDRMPKGLTIAYEAETTDNGFEQQIEQWLSAAENPSMVVVDMLEQIKGSRRRTEDSYNSDSRILKSIHNLGIKHNICIMCVLHTRKGDSKIVPSDPFNEMIGSIAQFGSADCSWMIQGNRNNDHRRLSVICRDNDDGQEDFEAVFENHRWKITGTVEEIAAQKAKDEYDHNPVVFTIRELINSSGGGWYGTMRDLINETLTRTKGNCPAATPEKMKAIVDSLAYSLYCEGICIERPNKNGGTKGRQYKFYRKSAEQMTIMKAIKG